MASLADGKREIEREFDTTLSVRITPGLKRNEKYTAIITEVLKSILILKNKFKDKKYEKVPGLQSAILRQIKVTFDALAKEGLDQKKLVEELERFKTSQAHDITEAFQTITTDVQKELNKSRNREATSDELKESQTADRNIIINTIKPLVGYLNIGLKPADKKKEREEARNAANATFRIPLINKKSDPNKVINEMEKKIEYFKKSRFYRALGNMDGDALISNYAEEIFENLIKHKPNIIKASNGKDCSLKDILSNPLTQKLFLHFSAKDFAFENAHFLIAMQNSRINGSPTPQQIYDRYIKDANKGSVSDSKEDINNLKINLPNPIQIKLDTKAKSDEISLKDLEAAEANITALTEVNTFLRFKTQHPNIVTPPPKPPSFFERLFAKSPISPEPNTPIVPTAVASKTVKKSTAVAPISTDVLEELSPTSISSTKKPSKLINIVPKPEQPKKTGGVEKKRETDIGPH